MKTIADLQAAVTHVEKAAAAAIPLVGHSPAADAAIDDAATRVEAVAVSLDSTVTPPASTNP